MYLTDNQKAFLFLLKAGLWKHEVQLSHFEKIDFNEIYRIADEQAVVGLVAAGIEYSADIKPPREAALQFVGCALQIEQMNMAMNEFIARLVGKLSKENIHALLVKGQGVAQCYERPLWRSCGDVDLLLTETNYNRAKEMFCSFADSEETEVIERLHKSYKCGIWEVELHGNMRGGILKRVDRLLDEIQEQAFCDKNFRVWRNNGTAIYLPSVDDDIFFVFTHILQHYFEEGVGIRQICDWCRLLWIYRGQIDKGLLEIRLVKASIMTEWKTFASLAVEWLGMPTEAMIIYSPNKKWKKKGDIIMSFVLKTGNFGNNRNLKETYNYPYLIRKIVSLFRHICDIYHYSQIFPIDAIKVLKQMIMQGVISIFSRENQKRVK